MFIKEIVIDGFKSYAQRTVISGWDPTFNAITGLNGSGKSNVLDAICFVLGITNLSQVRASNLTDLIYKSGQSGVTKATVSLIFDNSEAAASPIGYEHCDTITVTRTIILGGRNKYLINGHVVQASAVQNLFHSVQLNVNNPHFLIMQGRITKVLNMKPPEILGMIEEAAGTRMFEAKKQATIKTIEKKQSKVDEIDKILAEDINPTLEKLRAERKAYLEWAKNNTDCERLARFCVAYEYTMALATSQSAVAKQHTCVELIQDAIKRTKEAKALVASKEAELKVRETERAAAMSGSFKKLVDEEDSLGKSFAQASAVLENQKKALKDEEKAANALQKALADAEAAVATLFQQLKVAELQAQTAADAAKASTAKVEDLVSKLSAAKSGFSINAATGEAATLADQLLAAKRDVTRITTEISSAEMKIKHLQATQKDLEKAAKGSAAEHAALQAALQKSIAALEGKRTKRAALSFDSSLEESLRTKRDELQAEISKLEEFVENSRAQLAGLELQFDVAAMGAGFDARSIKGSVAQLFNLKDAKAATAMEVAAGGKLFQIVVDNEAVGKALLEKGNLKRRVTLIPLNKVRRNVISKDKVDLAAALSKGLAVPAISLIDFDESVRPAMEYTFGGFFVCANADVAKAITFNPKIAVPCVTFDGDLFDPAGTLEGGSKPDVSGDPLLLRIGKAQLVRRKLAAAQSEIVNIENQLTSMAKASAAFATLSSEIELAEHEVELTQKRLGSSQQSTSEAKLTETLVGISNEEERIKTLKGELKAANVAVKDVEASMANAAKARDAQIADLTKQLDAAKKAATTVEAEAKKAQQTLTRLRCEHEAAVEEKQRSDAALVTAKSALEVSQRDVNKATSKCADLEGQYQKVKAALEAAREVVASTDKAMKTIIKERDAASRMIEDLEAEVKKQESQQKTLAKDAAAAEKVVKDLLATHAWIDGDKEFFGKPHTDYDFEATDPKAASAKLTSLEKKQAELERKINKKVIGMIEQAEREYADLVNKKRIIENDKAKIEKVIAELDEKKNEALKTTWAKVNKDFGAIFATLLPGVTAKLDPAEGGSVLDGLEVKVAFNGVWKESLTELSGGQRSLLALSLILALLLFKPAPMYILDEVDAALDLSHTQNIGHMIKTYFGKSQFIVVSLKQGMFNNANVIFRTKFVEGIGSTVAATRPTASESAAAVSKSITASAAADDENVTTTKVATKSSRRAPAAGAGDAAVV